MGQSMEKERFVKALACLGEQFRNAAAAGDDKHPEYAPGDMILADAMKQACDFNPWFIPRFVSHAFRAWSHALEEDKIRKWYERYGLPETLPAQRKKIALVMAGNIPMVGFHDLLCVLASGNHALVKLSSSDDKLIPALARILGELDPGFQERIDFVSDRLTDFDAIIATGSNNTSRYFEYYFGKYPHIIRRNRNGVAVIRGNENDQELEGLADDIFLYFGLGCRSVSKFYIPEGYDIKRIFPVFEKYAFLADLHKYRNNYDYQKSLFLINGTPHYDNGFLLIREDTSLISPVSVLNTEFYASMDALSVELLSRRDQIQCMVSADDNIPDAVRPGLSQLPELWDYADGVDTMEFLLRL
jgi:hypothetical protein